MPHGCRYVNFLLPGVFSRCVRNFQMKLSPLWLWQCVVQSALISNLRWTLGHEVSRAKMPFSVTQPADRRGYPHIRYPPTHEARPGGGSRLAQQIPLPSHHYSSLISYLIVNCLFPCTKYLSACSSQLN